jgi:hypothetical protein
MPRKRQENWNRLQHEYRRAVLAEYPNPKREGCPGVEALRDLAELSVRRMAVQKDPRWKHAVKCGPCYEEYISLREVTSAG